MIAIIAGATDNSEIGKLKLFAVNQLLIRQFFQLIKKSPLSSVLNGDLNFYLL
ncbi:hypothetical protein FBR4_0574 [Lactiplantibacillus plantarum]|nr:Hypothetical protein H073_03508 [Lactiplantibacillus plantarum UCMA 3037]KZE00757.1 hypothetical protein FBR4_0574 [Lactiplantibacillus plantarum]KZT93344.1 hypothetical protein Nizo2257_2588 [Lactiplantibacillus plantarum]KZT98535.1 hypothetical protein Nizo2258_1187 [Lactiplantibacillus plantarum]KZU43791.1 hypothetical protein Nizo2753_0665 [Lactiplantibacillus plantarum]